MKERGVSANEFNETTARRVLDTFSQNGWNLYATDETRNPNDEIKMGPTKTLEVNQTYVILPAAKDPANPDQVWAALEQMAQSLNRRMPRIKINNEWVELIGLEPKQNDVKLHTPDGRHVSYRELIAAIPTYAKYK